METKTSQLENLKNLFASPNKLFESIKESPTILLPIIAATILSLISSALSTQTIAASPEFLSQQLSEALNPVAGQILLEQLLSQNSNANNIIGNFLSVLIYIIITCISVGFNLLLVKLFSGDATFKQLLSLSLYVGIVTQIFFILSSIIMILLNTPKDVFALSTVLMPNSNIYDPLHAFLGTISIPIIYNYILFTLGITKLSGFETHTKSIIITVINYILTAAFVVGGIILTLQTYSTMSGI